MMQGYVSDTQHPAFVLNPELDRQSLRRTFAERGRVQISPFLACDGAERLREHLRVRDDWRIAIRPEGKKVVEIESATWDRMNPSQREALKRLSGPTELTGFRYLFEQIKLAEDASGPIDPQSLPGCFVSFLCSEQVLELLRAVTGIEDIAFADARGTCYAPGHYLTMHHDELEGAYRRAAYVFNLTPGWRAEWGGLLMFHDDRDDVTEGLVPRMNVLNIFAVPQHHSVSEVTAFAPRPRYSITGWLRANAPSGAATQSPKG